MNNLYDIFQTDCHIEQPESCSIVANNEQDDEQVTNDIYSQVKSLLNPEIQNCLLTWKTLNPVLPKSILDLQQNEDFYLSNIFTIPDCEEVEMLAKDNNGNRKRLNSQQLDEIRRFGYFNVPSQIFDGGMHKWKLSECFIKGTSSIQNTWKKNVKRSIRLIICYAKWFILGKSFSIANGFVELYTFLCAIIDLLFGLPHLNHGDKARKLFDERNAFIVNQLSPEATQFDEVAEFWRICEKTVYISPEKFYDHVRIKVPCHRFVNNMPTYIDLGLCDNKVLKACLPILEELIDSVRGNWFPDFKDKFLSKFKEQNLSQKEILQKEGLKEYLSRLFDAIRKCDKLEQIYVGSTQLLIQEASFKLIENAAKESFVKAFNDYQINCENVLLKKHNYLSQFGFWKEKMLVLKNAIYFRDHRFDIHNEIYSKCIEKGLLQHAFMIEQELKFLKEHEQSIENSLSKKPQFPDEEYIFSASVKSLCCTKVYKKDYSLPEKSKPVDTILVDCDPTKSSNQPKIVKRFRHRTKHTHKFKNETEEISPFIDSGLVNQTNSSDNSDPQYIMKSELNFQVTTRYFMWRWIAFILFTLSWQFKIAQFFYYTVPFKSLFGLTTLFRRSPIYYDLRFDPKSGYLHYSKDNYHHTIISFLIDWWSKIRKAEADFNARPSSGIIDHRFARPFYWIWIYVFRGFFMSILLLLTWPAACLVVTTLSFLFGFVILILFPFVSLVIHLVGILIWEKYRPVLYGKRILPFFHVIIYQLFLKGLFQTIISSLIAFIFCPFAALMVFLWAILAYIVRSLWELFIFYCVIKPLGRVPPQEDCMVAYVSGPESDGDCFLSANPEEILVILCAKLEMMELDLWKNQWDSIIQLPHKSYKKLMKSLSFLPFEISNKRNVFNIIRDKENEGNNKLSSLQFNRNEALNVNYSEKISERIKLSGQNMDKCLYIGTQFVEFFYNTRILPRLQLLHSSVSAWWSALSVEENNFQNLCFTLFKELFSTDVEFDFSKKYFIIPLKVEKCNITEHFQNLVQYMINNSNNPLLKMKNHDENLESNNSSDFLIIRNLIIKEIKQMFIELPKFPIGIFTPYVVRLLPQPLSPLCKQYDSCKCCCGCNCVAKTNKRWTKCEDYLRDRADIPEKDAIDRFYIENKQYLNYPENRRDMMYQLWKLFSTSKSIGLFNEFDEQNTVFKSMKNEKYYDLYRIKGISVCYQDFVYNSQKLISTLENLGRIYHPIIVNLLIQIKEHPNSVVHIENNSLRKLIYETIDPDQSL